MTTIAPSHFFDYLARDLEQRRKAEDPYEGRWFEPFRGGCCNHSTDGRLCGHPSAFCMWVNNELVGVRCADHRPDDSKWEPVLC